MNVTTQTAESLRVAGYYFAAGALAAALGKDRHYGCHGGMRSTLERDRDEFFAGYDAAAARGRR